MLTSREADEAYRSLTYVSYSKDKVGNAKYKAQIADIEAEWQDWLEDEYAYDLPKDVLGEIYRRAWDEGHSSGYYNVEGYYQDFSDFARNVVVAVSK